MTLQSINQAMSLYVLEAGTGFSCLGFDVAERKRRAVLEWLGFAVQPVEPGTLAAFEAYQWAMNRGAEHHRQTGKRCNADLEPALIGLERVEVVSDGMRQRFYVGKSSGWMPCHLEIKRADSSGGCAAYVPKGAAVRLVGAR